MAAAWLAAGIGEMRDARQSRASLKGAVHWTSVLLMGLYLMAYGAVFTARTAPGASVSGGDHRTIAAWSLCGSPLRRS